MRRKKAKNPQSDYSKQLDWWLSDDPPPSDVESRLRAPYIPPPDDSPMFKSSLDDLPPDEPGATNITINVHVPKVKLPPLKKADLLQKLRTIPRHPAGQLAILAVVMMLAGLGAHSFIFKPSSTVPAAGGNSPNQVLGASQINSQTAASPLTSNSATSVNQPTLSTGSTNNGSTSNKASFTPVAPANNPDLGNYAFAKTSYDSSTGTYTYIDVLDGKVFSVTEQVIPSQYSSGQDAVDKIATSINATDQIITTKVVAYMLTDAKSGQQTIVFSMNKLLIVINSNFQHPDSDWKSYIETLQ